MDNAKTKIAIISHSLGEGGAERFAGKLSFMLEDLNYEVHHIIVNDVIDYEFAGQLYNLGAFCPSDSGIFKKLKKGFLLRQYLKQHQIDILIDNRSRNTLPREIFTRWIYARRKKYFITHSFHLKNYLPESVFFAKWLYSDAQKIICVSKAIEAQVIQKYGLQNTVTIYNPIEPIAIPLTTETLPEKYVLFYGRLDEKVKNFTLLLEAFLKSGIFQYGYQLVILGNGPSKALIEDKIQKLNLGLHVKLLPFLKNPFSVVRKAKFTLLTSRYEGFPMSIIESLSLGVPVVAVDCQSGPNEIVINEKNGLLIENHNVKALAEALNRMVTDATLYQTCRDNAAQSVAHLHPGEIAKSWEKILRE
ncbi:glycosyltransferase family 4 protein [Flavobacterium sp. CYK-4]|uniref:glycosyltransferase n=1 Tax=Flavobacterium lotistagni TaxID=2709660 RepID=UPI001409AFAF|nr:glycosyltransferase [Flavobacterium lotistagni]NHM07018.1 glycosyltransferase family 4 protein [Flavobacterium lotistagni]